MIQPNSYEDPGCQETNSPSERIVLVFFRCGYAKRRPSLATCSVFISVGWCTTVLTWEEASALVQTLATAPPGEARTMKLTLIGRPGKVETRGQAVVFQMH